MNFEKYFLPETSTAVLDHPIEKRGFVSVPLDYDKPELYQLRIFYRYIPADGTSLTDRKCPLLYVVNGGPGLPSKLYRKYDYDYTQMDTQEADRLRPLTKLFRVLIIDQRGTAGYSTALNMQAEPLDYDFIAKYFSADHVARDHERVINEVLLNENFFMVSQSFGGMVGSQYMWRQDIRRKPSGIIFTSSAMPFEDARNHFIGRRSAQKILNLELKKFEPGIAGIVAQLRSYLETHGEDPFKVNTLWSFLGKGNAEAWPQNLLNEITKIQKMSKVDLDKYFSESMGTPDLLNYVLSSSNMSAGETDCTLASKAMAAVAFEDWMFDECKTFLKAGEGTTYIAKAIQRMDQKPPKPINFGTPDEMADAINSIPALFTFGDNDSMTPASLGLAHMKKHFYREGKTQFRELAGGHSAVFTDPGAQTVREWINATQPKVR